MLAWHVHYWDYLGWKDMFGSPSYTERQKRYKAALKQTKMWTPQLIVANKVSRGGKPMAEAIRAELGKKPRLSIDLKTSAKDGKAKATVKLKKLDGKLDLEKDVAAMAVLFIKRTKTKCNAGENKGKTLDEWFPVVRTKAIPLKEALDKGATVEFKMPKGELGIAVLVENTATMRTIECTWAAVQVGGG